MQNNKFFKFSCNNWFTLIEIMIVITIIALLTLMAFIPYNFYSNISKTRISSEILKQTMSDSIFNANWKMENNSNVSIWLLLRKWSNELQMLSYPYNMTWAISFEQNDNVKFLKSVNLEKDIQISKIIVDWSEVENLLYFYKAPSWDLTIYKTPTNSWTTSEITLWFKWAIEWVLSKKVKNNIK